MTILQAVRDPALFGPFFRDPESWRAWEAFLSALFGLKLTKQQVATYRNHTGRKESPKVQVQEAWLIVGRRGGKSRIAALIAVYRACFIDYGDILAPGEVGTLPIVAADRRQARTVMSYVKALIDSIPMLAQLVVHQTTESIELSTRCRIEIHTASWRSIRGYTCVGAVLDEVAFWRSEDSANPDVEIVNALRPAMATVPDALLVAISSPYARRGVLWDQYRKHYGQDGDPVLVWQAPTRAMNPTVDEGVIAAEYERDQAAASAEFGAEFRRDVETFITREMVEGVVVPGRRELPPVPGVQYAAFVDPSGGSQDSMTLAIAHQQDGRAVLDALRERKPPFSPEDVVREFAGLLKNYSSATVTGDRYAGEWPRERFREHGIAYQTAEKSKSDLYRDVLPLLNSGRVELLDLPRLHSQLLGLERRTSRGGRDSIDHGPGGHDDVINAAAGALVACASLLERRFFVRQDRIAEIVRPGRQHPFSLQETNLRDGCVILPDRFDLTVQTPRGCHLTLAPGGEAAALAVGYVKGLIDVRRTSIQVVDGPTTDDKKDHGGQVERLPRIVLEALLRIVSEKDDEIVLDEVVELVLRFRDEVGLPIQWVTADSFRWTGPLQTLQQRRCQTGELPEDDPEPYHGLKSAIYDGCLETYHYPPLLEQLAALRLDDEAGRVKRPRPGLHGSGREVADAVAGVVHLLVRRRSSWPEEAGKRQSIQRVSIPRPTLDEKPPDEPPERPIGRIPISREEWILW